MPSYKKLIQATQSKLMDLNLKYEVENCASLLTMKRRPNLFAKEDSGWQNKSRDKPNKFLEVLLKSNSPAEEKEDNSTLETEN